MNYKTMLVSVLLAGSMQTAWGMDQNANGNNNAIPKQEVSEIAQLAAALEAFNLKFENKSEQLNNKITNVEQKIGTMEEKLELMEKKTDTVEEKVKLISKKLNVDDGPAEITRAFPSSQPSSFERTRYRSYEIDMEIRMKNMTQTK